MTTQRDDIVATLTANLDVTEAAEFDLLFDPSDPRVSGAMFGLFHALIRDIVPLVVRGVLDQTEMPAEHIEGLVAQLPEHLVSMLGELNLAAQREE